jgi:hypothetical protein
LTVNVSMVFLSLPKIFSCGGQKGFHGADHS